MNPGRILLVSVSLITIVSCESGGSGQNLSSTPSPGEQTPISTNNLGSWPSQVVSTGENTFFTADDGLHGRAIWVLPRNSEAAIAADVHPGPQSTHFT